ncbi:MAG: TIGR03546 family protein [Nitrospinota bacterium]
MVPIIGTLNKVVKILHSDATPAQVAGGACMGMVMGFTPLFNVHNLIVLFLVLIVRVNWGSFTLSWLLFSILAYLLDPISHVAGLKLLKLNALFDFWTYLYNVPLMTWTGFNNSITLGSFVISMFLYFPLFIFVRWLVIGYRGNLKVRIEKLWLVKAVKGSNVYRLYARVRDFTE